VYTLYLSGSLTYESSSLPVALSFSLSLPLAALSHAHSFYLHSVISASVFSISLHRKPVPSLSGARFPSPSRHLVGTYPPSLFRLFTLPPSPLLSPHSSSPAHAHTRNAAHFQRSTRTHTRVPREGYRYKSIRAASTRARAQSSNVDTPRIVARFDGFALRVKS